jgi:hypothetical protein
VLGVFAVGIATAGLTAERASTVAVQVERASTVAVQVERLEEHEAGLAGVQLLLFALATILAMLVALDIGLTG